MFTTQKNFYKKLFGKVGENKAEKFLIDKGYKILAKNYKDKIGEVDIVAMDKETVVFVEVKTRSSDKFGLPCEAVNQKKQQKYKLVALEYLSKNGREGSPVRFDVIEILNDEINHIIDAFYV